jgi:hypothetical protein
MFQLLSPIFMSLPVFGVALCLSRYLSTLSMFGCVSLIAAILLTIMMLHNTKKKDNTIQEKYPFQTTIEVGLNLHRILDYIYDLCQMMEKNQQRPTFSMNVLVSSLKLYYYCYLINNVYHII